MAKIIAFIGTETEIFDVRDNRANVLGRSSKADISIKDKKISREHARLSLQDGKFTIEDMGSSNGTFLNGKKITSAEIKDGDRIRIGKTELIFNDDGNDPLVGQVIKGYRIEFRLGQGSMGAVYLANQLSMDREVAFKVLKKELSEDAEYVKRFEQEARLAGKLNHKNVVGAHDFGEFDGRYFFSMEYVRGKDIQQIINQSGPLDYEKCLDYSLQVARGLEHAHKLGIIHQDIKPLNILVNEDNVAKIADLGLAKDMRIIDPTDKEKMRIMGTPQYIAPEVLKKQMPDQKSDIYSLGATIFHMATGRPCFVGSDIMDIVKQRLEFPTPEPAKFNSKISANFSNFILRLMDKNPDNRPADMSEVIDMLENIDKVPVPSANATPDFLSPSPAEKISPEDDIDIPPARKRRRKPIPESARINKKKNKRLAIFIVYLLSVGVAGVLAFFAYQFLKPDPEEEARKNYQTAKEFIESGKDDDALRYLEFSLGQYPNAKINPEIEKMLGYLKRKNQLNTYAKQYKNGNLDRKSMRGILGRFIERENDASLKRKATALLAAIPEVTEEEYASERENHAREERGGDSDWLQAKRSAEGNIESGDYEKARKTLSDYIGEHPDTEESYEAQEILDGVYAKINEAFEEELASVKNKSGTDIVALWNGYEKLFFKSQAISHQEKVHKELEDISGQFRKIYRGFYNSAERAFLTLNVKRALATSKNLQERFNGSSWQNRVLDTGKMLEFISQYSFLLDRKLSSGNIYEVSVPGIEGEWRLTLDSQNDPALRIKDEFSKIDWNLLYSEDLWKIAPANDLNDEQAAGAALHFMARGHWGFARSYLVKVNTQSSALDYAKNLIVERRNKRHIVENILFDSYSIVGRFEQLEGICNFANNTLDCSGKGFFSTALKGRLFNIKDIAIKMQAAMNGDGGSFKLKLNSFGGGILTALFSSNGTGLYFEKPISTGGEVQNPLESNGRSLGRNINITLSVRDGKAVLSSGREDICTLDVGVTKNTFARLYLEFEDVNGSISNLTVAEGL